MRSDAPALLPLFRSQHQAELLSWLLLHQGREFGMTELAQQVGVALSTLHAEVARLTSAGLITSRSHGRNRLLSANMDHPAAPSLAELLMVTFGPRVVIGEEFAKLGADEVIVFGSWAARYSGRQGRPPADVDVLLVGDVDRSAAYDAADRAQARLGLAVNVTLRTLAQWREAADALVLQIQASPYVVAATGAAEVSR